MQTEPQRQKGIERMFSALEYVPLAYLLFFLVCLKSLRADSLWMDECITYWVIKDGPQTLFERALHFQGQSPLYYFLVWIFERILGAGELALRSLSYGSLAVSCLGMYSIARRFLSKKYASLAVILFLSCDAVITTGVGARPYAFALACVVVSLYAFLAYLDKPRLSILALYVLSSVLLLYAHILFALSFATQLCYLLFVRKTLERTTLKQIFAAGLSIFLLALPLFVQLKDLYARRHALSFGVLPGIEGLIFALLPPALFVYAAVSFGFVKVMGCPFRLNSSEDKQRSLIRALLLGYVLVPLVLFVYSQVSGVSLFSSRYYVVYCVPLSLLLASLCSRIADPKTARFFCGVLVFLVFFREAGRVWVFEEWKQAIAIVNSQNFKNESAVLFAYTGLVEAKDRSWLEDSLKRSYLLAPFSYYTSSLAPVALPASFSWNTREQYSGEFITPHLTENRSVLLVCLDQQVHDAQIKSFSVCEYFRGQLDGKGYSSKELAPHRLVRVFEFTK